MKKNETWIMRSWRCCRSPARLALGIVFLCACSLPPPDQSQAGRKKLTPAWAWGPKDMREEADVIELKEEVTRTLESPEPPDTKKQSR